MQQKIFSHLLNQKYLNKPVDMFEIVWPNSLVGIVLEKQACAMCHTFASYRSRVSFSVHFQLRSVKFLLDNQLEPPRELSPDWTSLPVSGKWEGTVSLLGQMVSRTIGQTVSLWG